MVYHVQIYNVFNEMTLKIKNNNVKWHKLKALYIYMEYH